MIKINDHSLVFKLLLVPVVATVCFTGYLIYSSIVLSSGNEVLTDIRDLDFQLLDAAEKNVKAYERIVDALNTAAGTGELDFLDLAKNNATEVLSRLDALERLDLAHKSEIETLKAKFNAFMPLAYDVAQEMATKRSTPSLQKTQQLRELRHAYLADVLAYKRSAENEYKTDVNQAIVRSDHAQAWGLGIGTAMVVVVAALTLWVTRGIVALERGIAEKNRKLETVNLELEREIAKLKAAEEAAVRAQAASQVKDQFLANMSHEIRTPLNAIIGMSYLAMKVQSGSKQQDYLGKIHFSGQHLLGVINDILDIAKIESGNLELENLAFRSDRLLENVAALMGDAAAAKNLDLVFSLDPAVPAQLRGDFQRLGQVLINYIGNAIKFTERGRIKVRINRQEEADSAVLLRFEVEDTGIGLKWEDRNKLFQPFQQADSSTSRRFGGTGLGLTLSKQFAEMMGGEVGVDSIFGKGSTFWFTARLGKVADGEICDAATHGPADEAQSSSLSSLRGASILLVEDNTFNQEVATEMLEQAGVIVTLACNGQEALARLSTARFDCVLMDLQMPVMDGLEATRIIRSDPALSNVRIIALSANTQSTDRERCASAGMDDFITKPFSPKQFYMTLAKWLPDRPFAPPDSTVTNVVAVESQLPVADNFSGNIDFSVLAKMIGSDSAKLRRFSLKFLESARLGMSEIERALLDEDASLLGALGHRSKTAARYVGAIGYAELCQELEQSGKRGDLSRAREIVLELREMLPRIEREITQVYLRA